MKALTIHQPWAWALIHSNRRVENRTRQTSYRGKLLIHASKRVRRASYPWAPPEEQLERGAIIGVVDLIDCVRVEDLPRDAWSVGPWCWIVRNPQPIDPPILCSGRQVLWTPSDDVVARVLQQVQPPRNER